MRLFRHSAVVIIVLSLTIVGMTVPLPGASGSGSGGFVGTTQAQSSTGPVDVDASDLPGDGSESNPYEISNVSELQAMEDDLTANYVLVSDIDASNTAQFDGGNGFDPVGPSFDNQFTGSFDGNDYTITGLTIDRPTENRVGLIGVVGDEGTVRDVSVIDANITGDRYAGIIAGTTDGEVVSSSVTGAVTGSDNVGGLAGSTDGLLRESSAHVTVKSGSQAGGLVGANSDTIRKSYATGTVNASGDRVGGLVGTNNNNTTVKNSYATGTVTGDSRIGGLIGLNGGTIQQTIAVGSVSGGSAVGGLVGKNTSSFYETPGTVTDSYFDTEATGQSASAGNPTGLTTAEMQGSAAEQNMNLAFGETWQTVSGDYPELIALSDSESESDSDSGSDSETSPISRSVSSSEIAPTETVTVTTELTGASGSVSTSSSYEPQFSSATVAVTVNGEPVDPIISEATTNGSTVTLGDVGTDATVTITEELTVGEELNVTHTVTGDVTIGGTTTDVEAVSVTVADIDPDPEPQSPVDEFDADGDDDIEITELGQAGQAFASGDLTITELGQVGAAFAS